MKPPLDQVMLDLETMGTGPSAAIVAIGAVAFSLEAEGCMGDTFYRTVDLDSAVRCGGQIDAGTVTWWMKQSDQARAALAVNPVHITQALSEFAEWVTFRKRAGSVKLWGNGAAFDNVILASAYRNAGLSVPWEHWDDRCYRTIKALHPSLKMQRTGTHHNALDDAVSQARHLLAIWC